MFISNTKQILTNIQIGYKTLAGSDTRSLVRNIPLTLLPDVISILSLLLNLFWKSIIFKVSTKFLSLLLVLYLSNLYDFRFNPVMISFVSDILNSLSSKTTATLRIFFFSK